MLYQDVFGPDGRIDANRLLAEFAGDRDAIVFPVPPIDRLADCAVIFPVGELASQSWDVGWQAVYAFALRPDYEGCRDRGRVLKVGLATTPARDCCTFR